VATPTVAVVYGHGAANLAQIAKAAQNLTDVLFVMDSRDEDARAFADILPKFGAGVVDLATAADADLKRLLAPATGILTYADGLIERTSRIATLLGLPYHSEVTARLLMDKQLQRETLNRALPAATPVAVVRARADLAPAAAAVGFPLVAKPLTGCASAFTYRCDTAAELELRLGDSLDRDRGTAWAIEALLRPGRHPAGDWLGDYVSVESLTVDGVTRHIAITDKLPLALPFRETGMVSPTALPPAAQDEVLALAGDAIRALGVAHGLTHTEIKLTPDGPRIIEVNGRLGGFVARLIERASGLDLVRLALRAALGLPVGDPAPVFRSASVWFGVVPPQARVKVTALSPARRLRTLPGVWRVERLADAGDVLDWEFGSGQRAADLWAEAPGLDAVPSLLDRLAAESADVVTFERI
jgi:biotin carboxylase